MTEDRKSKVISVLLQTGIAIVVVAFVGALLHYFYSHHISQDRR